MCNGYTAMTLCNSKYAVTFATPSYKIESADLKLTPEVAELSLKALQLGVHATELLFVVHMLYLIGNRVPEINTWNKSSHGSCNCPSPARRERAKHKYANKGT